VLDKAENKELKGIEKKCCNKRFEAVLLTTKGLAKYDLARLEN
jgi:hypothetical protein